MNYTLFTQNIAEVQLSYSTKVKASDRPKITSSKDSYEIFKEIWPSFEHREYCYVLLLNRANQLLGVYQVSSGGTTGTFVDPKLIFQAALKTNASSVIIAHNHPSGNLQPSDLDKKLTSKLINAGSFLDINVLDHLIIINDNYKSFADDGLMW